jgi:hypothetical protein
MAVDVTDATPGQLGEAVGSLTSIALRFSRICTKALIS